MQISANMIYSRFAW